MIPSLLRGAAIAAVFALCVAAPAQIVIPQLPPPADKDKGDQPDQPDPNVKVVDRGPIHEAFAQPGADVRGKGMTAPKAPPAPIPELPPDTKPDGNNVKWIPGYWAWDDDKQDFIWISGFYRDVPPGREWQPGKWAELSGKWTFTPGWWRPVDMNQWRVDLPEPPKSVERGPSIPSDDPNAVWIPGSWEFRNEQFVWRPGYWAAPNGDMLWQPPQYVTSGSGYSYVPGYWDYPLEDRGLLFAPVSFTQPLWQNPGWCFRPQFALNVGLGTGWGCGGFFNSLFINPGFNNFCFGNYFPTSCFSGIGFCNPIWGGAFGFGSMCGGWGGWGGYRPWCAPTPGFCNPTWNNYCWLNRGNPNWAVNTQRAFVGRTAGVVPRSVAVSARPSSAGAGRPLAITPQGFGRGVQTAVRGAVASAQPTPFIQPAKDVARTQQAVRANPATSRTRPDATPGGRPTAVGSGAAVRTPPPAAVQSPPLHAGTRPAAVRGPDTNGLRITPGGQAANNPVVPAGGNTPARPADRTLPRDSGGRPDPAQVFNPDRNPVVRPNREPINVGLPRDLTPPRTNPAPIVRPDRGVPVNPGFTRDLTPIRPQNTPSFQPPPAYRPSAPAMRPSAPAYRPSAPIAPAFRPGPINMGGGARGPVGGGGARPGGGGGARPGGKR